MKVIYQGQLWAVVGDDGDGLWLESMDDTRKTYAPYSSQALVVDPTDGEVEAVSWLASQNYRPAAKND